MSIGLLDLPNEVLANICAFLDTTHLRPGTHSKWEYTNARPSLCALCVVNRHMYRIARHALLDDISLHMESSGVECPREVEEIGRRFPWYCIDYPAILDCVRKFSVYWASPAPDNWAARFFNIISLAPHLIDFRIRKFDDGSHASNRLDILHTVIGRLRSLKTLVIDIEDIAIPPRMFLYICNMRHLRRFETSCSIDDSSPPPEEDFEDVHRQRAPDTSLDTLRCSGERVALGILRHVLLRSSRLEKLVLSLSGSGVTNAPDDAYWPGLTLPRRTEVFRSDLLVRTLTSRSVSLRELAMVSPFLTISLQDESTLDLSGFHQLRQLKLSSRLICHGNFQRPNRGLIAASSHCSDEAEWYRALPDGLELLEIYFDTRYGVLWHSKSVDRDWHEQLAEMHAHDCDMEEREARRISWHSDFEMGTFKPSLSEEVQAARFRHLSWIMGFTRDVAPTFQRLRRLGVIETEQAEERRRRSWERVDLAKAYPEVFGCPGLDFELSVRVPDRYVVPPLRSLRG